MAKIKISRQQVEMIIAHGQEQLPIECCGLLGGTLDNNDILVDEVYPMANVDQSPEHFSLDPKEQFKAYFAMRDKGQKLLGNYHSHPATPSRPSQEDIRLAHDPKLVYMILSLAGDTPVLKSFQIKNGTYSEILMEIKD